MKLFQNFGVSRNYVPRLLKLTDATDTFETKIDVFLNDRYGSAHLLKPVMEKNLDTFFTLGDTETIQRRWALEQGLSPDTSLRDILLAQIEHHRTEVFYNLDTYTYDDDLIGRLPGCVKFVLGWRAAPGHNRFQKYDLILSNFPSIRATYESQGVRTAEFFPSHDPVLDSYARNKDRDIDVLFYGGFSRHHLRRTELLSSVAKLSPQYNIAFCLDNSRYTRWAETPLGWFGPLSKVRRPKAIRTVARAPVFGRDVYDMLSRAKIVFNAAIDMAGADRGNMRCFEALGAGALLLTDTGHYPQGMVDGSALVTYHDGEEACAKIEAYISNDKWQTYGTAGHEMVRTIYSKSRQYEDFLRLLK